MPLDTKDVLYCNWTRRRQKMEMEEVEEKKRAKDEDLAEDLRLKSRQSECGTAGRAAAGCPLPCPARKQAGAPVVGPTLLLVGPWLYCLMYCRRRQVQDGQLQTGKSPCATATTMLMDQALPSSTGVLHYPCSAHCHCIGDACQLVPLEIATVSGHCCLSLKPGI